MLITRKFMILSASAVAILAGLLVSTTGIALAHGSTTVGVYELVIGFHVEPAIQGELNGLDLFVTNTKTDEKVNGLEETLQAEVIFGSSKKEVTLYPREDEDG